MLLTQTSNVILKPFSWLIGLLLEGIFWFLGLFMEYPSAGLAIIIMTILIYLLLLPLTVKQQKFSKLSNKMNPELTAIREKYKGRTDQESMQKMNTETQMVYQKYGVNPSGSCIQLLIQMPILYALYRVLYNMPAYVGRIKDVFYPTVSDVYKLSNKEQLTEIFKEFTGYSYYSKQLNNDLFYGTAEGSADYTQNTIIDALNRASEVDWATMKATFPSISENLNNVYMELEKFNTFLGMNIGSTPSNVLKAEWASDTKNWILIISVLAVPVLAAATQWINTKLMPQIQSNTGSKKGAEEENPMISSMKTMNTIMPLMSAFFCFSLPIGMGIYWITGSVVRSIIQIVVNKYLDKMDIDEMIKKNVEKQNEKRRKQGLPVQQISSNAKLNTKNAGKNDNKENKDNNKKDSVSDKTNVKKNLKDSTEYQNKNTSKAGSLASKANMVKEFNEKNNSKKD